TWAETPLAVLGRIPRGNWTVLYEGAGKIEMWGTLDGVRERPGRVDFHVGPHDQAVLWLRIWRTESSNPVRRIRVLMPGHERDPHNPWNPTFLERWRGMATLRFMDLQSINNSKLVHWRDRPRPEHATFSGRGVAPELLVDLANRLRADAWFCMPHLADDDY